MIQNSFKGIMKFNVTKYNNDILLNAILVRTTPKIKKKQLFRFNYLIYI